MLRLFSDGTIPATAVQRIAWAAWEDGWGRGSNLAYRLKQAGSQGAYTGNVQRDIFKAAKLAGLTERLPESYDFEVPGPDGIGRQASCFLPHEALHRMVSPALAWSNTA